MWKEVCGEAAGEGEEVKVDMKKASGAWYARAAGSAQSTPRTEVAIPNPS